MFAYRRFQQDDPAARAWRCPQRGAHVARGRRGAGPGAALRQPASGEAAAVPGRGRHQPEGASPQHPLQPQEQLQGLQQGRQVLQQG